MIQAKSTQSILKLLNLELLSNKGHYNFRMVTSYSLRTQADGTVSVKIHKSKVKLENMAYSKVPKSAFSNGDDDDEDTSLLLAEAYRPCYTLFLTMSTGTHTLSVTPIHRIRTIKATLMTDLERSRNIPHHRYDCAISYGDRELEESKTLEQCCIGHEATVNVILWEESPRDAETFEDRLRKSVAATSKYGGSHGQKTNPTKRDRSGLDYEGGETESHVAFQHVPISKKQKSVRFADEVDEWLLCSPPHPQKTTHHTTLQPYEMSGGLSEGYEPPDFHENLVLEARMRSCEELPNQDGPPARNRFGELKPWTVGPRNDSLAYPIFPRKGTTMISYTNDYISKYPDTVSSSKDHGSSSTAVRLTPQDSNAQPLIFNPLPAVSNTSYVRSPDARLSPGTSILPPSSIPGSLSPLLSRTATAPAHSYFPGTQQTSSRSSFDGPPISYLKTPSRSPATSDLNIQKFQNFCSKPIETPRPRSRTVPTPSPSPHQPSSTLEILNPYFCQASPPPPGFSSTLQSLNPYFTNRSSPPPKHTRTQHTPSRSPSNSPQPTTATRFQTTFDYFQAARSKVTPSESKDHLLHASSSFSHCPPPYLLPPPQTSIEAASPTLSPYSHRPPPFDRSGRSPSPLPSLGIDSQYPDEYISSPKPKPKSRPKREIDPKKTLSAPYLPPRRSPQLKPPSVSPPTSSPPHKPYTLPHTPLFYNYFPSSTSNSSPASLSTLSSSPSPPEKTYYTPLHPLPPSSRFRNAIIVPPLAYEILPKEYLDYRTVKQLLILQGWEMSREEWWGVVRILKADICGVGGTRDNLEVMARMLEEVIGVSLEEKD